MGEKNAFCPCGKFDAGRCLCPPANDNHHLATGANIIFLPSDARLKKAYVIHRLAIAYNELVPLSRHVIPDWLSQHVYGYQGLLIGTDGKSIDPLTIDVDEEIEYDRDPSMRWFDEMLRWHAQMPQQAPWPSQLRRMRALWLGIAIIAPSTASKIL